MESVYIETTVISYLVSRPSRDILVAAHQQTTYDWWASRRQEFECFISQVVIRVAVICNSLGYSMPVICTPEELMGV